MQDFERRMLRQREFGSWFRKRREDQGLSQRDISDAFDWTSGQYISNWERGLSFPPNSCLADLARLLGVSAKELVVAVYAACKAEVEAEERDALHQAKSHVRRAG